MTPQATRICAIVVTYFPDEQVGDNLAALRAQVDHVMIVDNGSSAPGLAMLRAAASDPGITLIEHGENLGIAVALNLGIREARDFDWVVLFDQDSRVRANFIENMMHCALSQESQQNASLFVPQYFDMRLKTKLPAILAPDGSIAVAMTSGSMMRRSLFDQVGYFEDLFIYEVDYEFSLRIRKLGRTIRECSAAALDHSPGDPVAFSVFGKTLFHSTNYKPTSRYYLYRNSFWLRQKYREHFPEYFRFSSLVLWKDLVKMLLAENQRSEKLRYIIRAVIDARRGKMGRLTL